MEFRGGNIVFDFAIGTAKFGKGLAALGQSVAEMTQRSTKSFRAIETKLHAYDTQLQAVDRSLLTYTKKVKQASEAQEAATDEIDQAKKAVRAYLVEIDKLDGEIAAITQRQNKYTASIEKTKTRHQEGSDAFAKTARSILTSQRTLKEAQTTNVAGMQRAGAAYAAQQKKIRDADAQVARQAQHQSATQKQYDQHRATVQTLERRAQRGDPVDAHALTTARTHQDRARRTMAAAEWQTAAATRTRDTDVQGLAALRKEYNLLRIEVDKTNASLATNDQRLQETNSAAAAFDARLLRTKASGARRSSLREADLAQKHTLRDRAERNMADAGADITRATRETARGRQDEIESSFGMRRAQREETELRGTPRPSRAQATLGRLSRTSEQAQQGFKAIEDAIEGTSRKTERWTRMLRGANSTIVKAREETYRVGDAIARQRKQIALAKDQYEGYGTAITGIQKGIELGEARVNNRLAEAEETRHKIARQQRVIDEMIARNAAGDAIDEQIAHLGVLTTRLDRQKLSVETARVENDKRNRSLERTRLLQQDAAQRITAEESGLVRLKNQMREVTRALRDKIRGQKDQASAQDGATKTTTRAIQGFKALTFNLKLFSNNTKNVKQSWTDIEHGSRRAGIQFITFRGIMDATGQRMGEFRRYLVNTAAVFSGNALLGGVQTFFGAIQRGVEGIVRGGAEAVIKAEDLAFSIQGLIGNQLRQDGDGFIEGFEAARDVTQDLIANFEDLAIKTTFTSGQIGDVFQRLATNFDYREAATITEVLSNAGSVMKLQSSDILEIGRALGQIKNNGTAMLEDLRQLSDRNIKVFDILAEGYDVSKAKIMEMISAGEILADDAIPMIVNSLATDFAGAGDAAAVTFSGLLTSIQDLTERGLRTLMTPAMEEAREPLIRFVEVLQSPALMDGLATFGSMLGTVVGGGLALIMDFGPAVVDVLANIGYAVMDGLSVLGDLGSSMYDWGAGWVSALADGVWSGMSMIVDAASGIGDMLGYWLAPGSPPRIAPDLDAWGENIPEQIGIGIERISLKPALDTMRDDLADVSLESPDLLTHDSADPGPGLVAQAAQFGLGSMERTNTILEGIAEMVSGILGRSTKRTKTGGAGGPGGAAGEDEDSQYYYDQMDRRMGGGGGGDAAKRQKEQDSILDKQVRLHTERGEYDQAMELLLEKQQQYEEGSAAYIDGELALTKLEKKIAQEQDRDARAVAKDESASEREAVKADKAAAAAAKRAATEEEQIRKAKLGYTMTLADETEQLALLEDELTHYAEGSADYYKTLTKIEKLHAKIEDGADTGSGASSMGLSIPLWGEDDDAVYDLASIPIADMDATGVDRPGVPDTVQGYRSMGGPHTRAATLAAGEQRRSGAVDGEGGPRRPGVPRPGVPRPPSGTGPSPMQRVMVQMTAFSDKVAVVADTIRDNEHVIRIGLTAAFSVLAAKLVKTQLPRLLAGIRLAFVDLTKFFLGFWSPTRLVIGAVIALALAWKTNFLGMRDALHDAIADVTPMLSELRSIVAFVLTDKNDGITGLFGRLKIAVPEAAGVVQAALGSLGSAVMAWGTPIASTTWPGIQDSLITTATWIANDGVDTLIDGMRAVTASFQRYVTRDHLWELFAATTAAGMVGGVTAGFSAMLSNLVRRTPDLQVAVQALSDAFTRWLPDAVPTLIRGVGLAIGALITGFLSGAVLVLKPLGELALKFVGALLPSVPVIVSALIDVLGGLAAWVAGPGVILVTRTLQHWIQTALETIAANLPRFGYNVGRTIGTAIANLFLVAGVFLGSMSWWVPRLVTWIGTGLVPALLQVVTSLFLAVRGVLAGVFVGVFQYAINALVAMLDVRRVLGFFATLGVDSATALANAFDDAVPDWLMRVAEEFERLVQSIDTMFAKQGAAAFDVFSASGSRVLDVMNAMIGATALFVTYHMRGLVVMLAQKAVAAFAALQASGALSISMWRLKAIAINNARRNLIDYNVHLAINARLSTVINGGATKQAVLQGRAAVISNRLNSSMLAQAGAFAAVSLAMYGVTRALEGYNSKVDATATKILEHQDWWHASADALKAYQKIVDTEGARDTYKKMGDDVVRLREQVEQETKALVRMENIRQNTASPFGDFGQSKRYEAQLAALNASKNRLATATQNLTLATEGEERAMQEVHDVEAERLRQQELAEARLHAQNDLVNDAKTALGDYGYAAAETAADINRLAESIGATNERIRDTQDRIAQDQADFAIDREQREANHYNTLADLRTDYLAAETIEEQIALQEQIDHEVAAYHEREREQVIAYAKARSEQRTHLGEMLIEQILSNAAMSEQADNPEFRRRVAATTTTVAAHYNVMGHESALAVFEAGEAMRDFAETGEGNLEDIITKVDESTEATAKMREEAEKLETQYISELVVESREANLTMEAFNARIDDIDRQVDVEVRMRYTNVNAPPDLNGGTFAQVGGAASTKNSDRFRAFGGGVAQGLSYIVGERGAELFTPRAPGFITPAHRVNETVHRMQRTTASVAQNAASALAGIAGQAFRGMAEPQYQIKQGGNSDHRAVTIQFNNPVVDNEQRLHALKGEFLKAALGMFEEAIDTIVVQGL